MTGAGEIVRQFEEMIRKGARGQEALESAVRLLKEGREAYDWVGIYLLEGDTLVLNNYIGEPTEHTHIPVGRGVCGSAVAERANKVIDDVRELDNYIACSLKTRSEIVVLIRRGEEILGQIDIDSDRMNAFTAEDEQLLERIASLLVGAIKTAA